jgi:hypothetical protein
MTSARCLTKNARRRSSVRVTGGVELNECATASFAAYDAATCHRHAALLPTPHLAVCLVALSGARDVPQCTLARATALLRDAPVGFRSVRISRSRPIAPPSNAEVRALCLALLGHGN